MIISGVIARPVELVLLNLITTQRKMSFSDPPCIQLPLSFLRQVRQKEVRFSLDFLLAREASYSKFFLSLIFHLACMCIIFILNLLGGPFKISSEPVHGDSQVPAIWWRISVVRFFLPCLSLPLSMPNISTPVAWVVLQEIAGHFSTVLLGYLKKYWKLETYYFIFFSNIFFWKFFVL